MAFVPQLRSVQVAKNVIVNAKEYPKKLEKQGFLRKMRSTCIKRVATGAERIDLAASRSYLEALLATSSALITPGITQDMLVRVRLALEEGVW